MPRKRSRRKKTEVVGLVGVGFDNQDGLHRVTRGGNFVLVGGSADTHEQMISKVIEVQEGLENCGESAVEISPEELARLLHEAIRFAE